MSPLFPRPSVQLVLLSQNKKSMHLIDWLADNGKVVCVPVVHEHLDRSTDRPTTATGIDAISLMLKQHCCSTTFGRS